MAGIIAHTVGVIAAAAEGVSLEDIDGQTYSRSALTTAGTPVTATAGVKFKTDGTIEASSGFGTGSSYSNVGDWLESGSASHYEIRCTLVSGDALDLGSTGVWESLGSERTYEQSVNGTSVSESSTVKFEIRRASTGGVLDDTPSNVVISADVSII